MANVAFGHRQHLYEVVSFEGVARVFERAQALSRGAGLLLSRAGAAAWSRARLVDVSAGGALLEDDGIATPPCRIDVAFEARTGDDRRVAGHVVREDRGAGTGGARRAGVAFESPLPADLLRSRLVANVSREREASGANR